ncbi:hypothetical protein, partial [Duffyella gerundensis]|uniref:hypothetical protein n=1 Tax=Duffyella gerundensis TaxID=1619313 RepID=UPI001CA3C40A
WVLGFGFWVLGFGFWVLGFGFWVLGFGFWVLGFDSIGVFIFSLLTWVLTFKRHHKRRGKSVFQGEPQGCGERAR